VCVCVCVCVCVHVLECVIKYPLNVLRDPETIECSKIFNSSRIWRHIMYHNKLTFIDVSDKLESRKPIKIKH